MSVVWLERRVTGKTVMRQLRREYVRKAIVIATLLMILVIGLTANQQEQPVVLTNDSDKWVDCPGMHEGAKPLSFMGT